MYVPQEDINAILLAGERRVALMYPGLFAPNPEQQEAIDRPFTMPDYNGTPPYELVENEFTLPFPAKIFQAQHINALAPRPASALYWDTGTGKTFGATCEMLFQLAQGTVDQWIVAMPPILLRGWQKFLAKIPDVSVMIYAGTPAERSTLKLSATFILMSLDIFKRDYDRIATTFQSRKVGMTIDEATSIKSIASQNHKIFRDFTQDQDKRSRILLTGTPLSTPHDAYAYMRLIAPGVYRNERHFLNIHVEKYDFYDKPIAWRELDLLASNMQVNASRVLKRDVLDELPDIVFTPMPYELAPAHKNLYRKLAEEQLIEYEHGGKFDATESSRLTQAVQQIVFNWAYFAQKEGLVAAGEELIEQVLNELGDKKLVVSGQYKMTHRRILDRFGASHGAVAIYGAQTAGQNNAAKDRFISDPKCRLLTLHPLAGGIGVDGLQEVCEDALFIEAPALMRHFTQVYGRLERLGQKNAMNIRIGIAQGTVQVNRFHDLLKNDELIDMIQPSFESLKRAIYGE